MMKSDSIFDGHSEIYVTPHPHISRVELISRQSNTIAPGFHESIGFKKEGRYEKQIKNSDGTLEADTPMDWTRKNTGSI